MKNLIFLFVLVGFSFTSVIAQTPTKEVKKVESEEVTGGPIMKFESLTLDYGEITKGSDPLRTLSFKNTGDAPLVIKHAKGSCGCTVPIWPKEPIMPGEESEIKVRYDTKRPGPIRKTIRITTNEEGNPHVIQLKGNVKVEKPTENLPKKEGGLTGK
jgi:hypothetical protein